MLPTSLPHSMDKLPSTAVAHTSSSTTTNNNNDNAMTASTPTKTTSLVSSVPKTHLVFGAPSVPSTNPAAFPPTVGMPSAFAGAGLTPAPLTMAGLPSSPVSAIIDMLHDSSRALFEYLRLTNSLHPGGIPESDRAKVATIVQHLTVVFNAAEGNQDHSLTAAAVRQLAKLNGADDEELNEYDQHIRMQAAGTGAGYLTSHDDPDGASAHSASPGDERDRDGAPVGVRKKPGRKPGVKYPPKDAKLGANSILNKPAFKVPSTGSPLSSSHASPAGGSTLPGGEGVTPKKQRGPRTALIRWSDSEWEFLQQQVLEHGRNFSRIMMLHGPQGTLTQTFNRFEVKHLANKWANERAKRERSGLPKLPEKKLLDEEAAAADSAESAAVADASELRDSDGDGEGDGVALSSGAATPVSRTGGTTSALGLVGAEGEDHRNLADSTDEDTHMAEAEEEDELMDDV